MAEWFVTRYELWQASQNIVELVNLVHAHIAGVRILQLTVVLSVVPCLPLLVHLLILSLMASLRILAKMRKDINELEVLKFKLAEVGQLLTRHSATIRLLELRRGDLDGQVLIRIYLVIVGELYDVDKLFEALSVVDLHLAHV